MVNFPSFTTALVAVLAGQAVAHPGEHHTPEQLKREIATQHAAHANFARSLKDCASNPATIARQERAIARRAATAERLRKERGIKKKAANGKRDQAALQKWAAINHDLSAEGYNLDTPNEVLFAGNASCSLVPETTIGPYYVEGEYVRVDVTEGQGGVPLHLDVQFVDTADCTAIPDLLADIWYANSTGTYSGVSARGQGGLDSTYGRGAQVTDEDGVAEWDALFPGHYAGRATHIHVLTAHDATIFPNSTYLIDEGVATHVGQFFFDQALISAVEQFAPYSSNTQPLTTNLNDGIAAGEATAAYDIFLDYVLLGDTAEDGLLAWIVVGVDATADHTSSVQAAAHYYEGGGVDNGNSGPPGGPPARS